MRAVAAPPLMGSSRVRVDGKLFALGEAKWYVQGLTYGPFRPSTAGEHLPEVAQVLADLKQIRSLGANAVRVYHLPPEWFLDELQAADLRVLVDVPWDKHRCFFEDWSARKDAIDSVVQTARAFGGHSSVFAISVGNEIPKDIVRFYGAHRVEEFVSTLLDAAKQEAPDCLVTYTNYPSTEFLHPEGMDFYCANVYLQDHNTLEKYLNHLQHVAGNLPLMLGEFGVDSLRNGVDTQARLLGDHVSSVFRCGLAGSFIFSFTDEWFSGGHMIDDWAFGVTDSHRQPKPAAAELRRVWSDDWSLDPSECPPVSVVVCSYNGGTTLEACLRSLVQLDYPDYEVLLIDDGSTDDTQAIAARFSSVRYIRQEQLGLSAARNNGAQLARGEIVAYTDSDCVADRTWLKYLITAMIDQKVDGIGGPNVTPPSDRWVARCVAASPGNPSHVMFDDRYAEHIPGCNMAFRKNCITQVGGFDVQFRQAGDDVDFCWRMLEAGMRIGYAPAALVWHRRRATLRAFWKQQKGYGRAEAMLNFKHPGRFSALGSSRWNGVIYGEGAVGLPLAAPKVFYGPFGQGLFQIIYRANQHSLWAYFTLLEWHAVAFLVLMVSIALPQLALISAGMWIASIAAAARSAWRAPLEKGVPLWCRPLVFLLYFGHPIVRSWHRYAYRFSRKRLPIAPGLIACDPAFIKRVSQNVFDLDWESDRGLGREELLGELVQRARSAGWPGEYAPEWKPLDLELVGDRWHTIQVHTATEELGGRKRFTRVRTSLNTTRLAFVTCLAGAVLIAATVAIWPVIGFYASAISAALFARALWLSRRRCQDAILRLIWACGLQAGLKPVRTCRSAASPKPPSPSEPPRYWELASL